MTSSITPASPPVASRAGQFSCDRRIDERCPSSRRAATAVNRRRCRGTFLNVKVVNRRQSGGSGSEKRARNRDRFPSPPPTAIRRYAGGESIRQRLSCSANPQAVPTGLL
ncbi:hypothetical protein KCP76_01115 [Salmonella enterica subsp. enterica serovar Weltevreden]|nr:hypothetical protein KCP76_01115 [Salmonella enterica subsp. enterica serovar Weltevreden]